MLNVSGNLSDRSDLNENVQKKTALGNCLTNSLKCTDVGLKHVRHLESFQKFCELFPHRVKHERNTESSVAFSLERRRDSVWRQDEPRRYAKSEKEIELKSRLRGIPEDSFLGDETSGKHVVTMVSGQLGVKNRGQREITIGKDLKQEVNGLPLKKSLNPSESSAAGAGQQSNHGVVSPCLELTASNTNGNYTPNDRSSVASVGINCPKLNVTKPDMAVLQPCQIDVLLSLAATDAPCSVMIDNCKYALLSGDIDQVITNYLIAAKFQLSDVMDRLLDQIRCRFPNVCRTHEFLSLPVEVVEMFLTDGELRVETELDVFFAALTWIDFNKMDRLRHAGRVLKCVRYMYIDPRDIITYIEPNIHLFTGVDGMEALLNMYRYKALVLSGTIPPPPKELFVPGVLPPMTPNVGAHPFGVTPNTSPIWNHFEPTQEYNGFDMDTFRRQIASCYHRHGFVEEQQMRQNCVPEPPCGHGSRGISLRGICGMDSHGRQEFRTPDSQHCGPMRGPEEGSEVSVWCRPDYQPGTHSNYRSSPFREKNHDLNRPLYGQETDYAAIRRRIRSFRTGRQGYMDNKEIRHSGEDRKERHSGEDRKERHRTGKDGKERHHKRKDGKERHSLEDGKERHKGEDEKECHSREERKEIRHSGEDRRGSSKGHDQTKRRESTSYQDEDETPLARNLRKQVSFTGVPGVEPKAKANADKEEKKKKKRDKRKASDRKASKGGASADVSKISQPMDKVSTESLTSKADSFEDLYSEDPGSNNNARDGHFTGGKGNNKLVKVKGRCTFRSFSSLQREEKGFQDIEFVDNYRVESSAEESLCEDISPSPSQNSTTRQASCQRGRSRAKSLTESVWRHSQDSRAIPLSAVPQMKYRAETCPGVSLRNGHRNDKRCRSLSLSPGCLE